MVGCSPLRLLVEWVEILFTEDCQSTDGTPDPDISVHQFDAFCGLPDETRDRELADQIDCAPQLRAYLSTSALRALWNRRAGIPASSPSRLGAGVAPGG